jgi:hypothetical protein
MTMSALFRILVALFGFISAGALSPIFTILAMLVLSIRYRAWEVPFLGLFMDFLWLPSGLAAVPLFTLGGLVLFWALEPLRREFLFS